MYIRLWSDNGKKEKKKKEKGRREEKEREGRRGKGGEGKKERGKRKGEEKWEENKEVAGAIVLVYDHHKSDLQNRSTKIQHKYYQAILSVQHVHLDHHNCIETIAVKGKAKILLELADKLIAMKGIQHGKLIMSGMV